MKQVGIREAQINLSKLLQHLPFELIKYGKVVARVVDVTTTPAEMSDKVTVTQEATPQVTVTHTQDYQRPELTTRLVNPS